MCPGHCDQKLSDKATCVSYHLGVITVEESGDLDGQHELLVDRRVSSYLRRSENRGWQMSKRFRETVEVCQVSNNLMSIYDAVHMTTKGSGCIGSGQKGQ